jgi:hypothetical protein
MPTGHRGGRIRPHDRIHTSLVKISLSSTLAAVRNTEQRDVSVKNKRNYRNRIKHIYEFWKEQYPAYYIVGVVALTQEQREDADMFWWKNEHDLVYDGLNVKMVKAFLAEKKKKANGKTSSYVQLRKYHDAIMYGAKAQRVCLPKLYYEEIERFLEAFKKETATAKKRWHA